MNPIQQKIYRRLWEDIAAGKFSPGDKLPFERDMAKEYHTNVMNVKTALGCLVKRGVIERRRRFGTVVAQTYGTRLPEEIRDAGEKLAILLYSAASTGIFWNQSTLSEIGNAASEYGFSLISKTIPVDRDKLAKQLERCAKMNPEALIVLDDNFENEMLFDLRDKFTLFHCPVIRLNRNGTASPLDIENTGTIDLDHFVNGVVVGKELIRSKCRRNLICMHSQTPYYDKYSIFFSRRSKESA